MADDDTQGALSRAINAGLQPPSVMNARASSILQTALTEQQAAAARDKERLRELAIHGACCAALAGAIVLRVTLLKGDYADFGSLLISGVLFIWGRAGFKPSSPVLARVIAQLEPQKLDQLLSLRPPAQGNALSLRPPPSAAGDPTPTPTPTKDPA